MPNLSTCSHCLRPIAWIPRSTTGKPLALDLDPVELATAHPDAPTYALNRSGYATAAKDLHKPPTSVYLSHRCPEYLAAHERLETLRVEVEAMDEQRPLVITEQAPGRLRGIA